MPLYPSLVAFLESNVPALTGYIGPLPLPQNPTLPALTYTQISKIRTYTYEGEAELWTERVQLDVWTTTYEQATSVAGAITSALSGYKGAMWNVDVEAAFIDNEIDGYEPDTRRRRKLIDTRISYRE